ncbi:hypothetical protein LI328DRAFT_159634 [Trichoderma asperelloides]|nr:hypothetical protein LI328DRAFT_159634 [Trichoderma asperelloides]
MTTRQAALSLYRRSLKLALDWAVHRHLWRGQALYIRSLFEANRKVSDPRQQRPPLIEQTTIKVSCCTKYRPSPAFLIFQSPAYRSGNGIVYFLSNYQRFRVIPGEIPSFKLFESDKTLAFLDVGPLSKGHAISNIATLIQLVIPKFHGAKLADIPDDQLSEILPTLKKLAIASGATDYNILQNNGTLAHQQVHHVSLTAPLDSR